ncbi:uncharacterized protein [Ptychodera flava]|uniref:uncharacterized protein isoform X2 n=1 Tax=Ptychodera flava TaxID=63121 RepID=UPI00396A160A
MTSILSIIVVLCLFCVALEAAPADVEERSNQKRFGCYRTRCGEGNVCMENHYGDAYCVPGLAFIERMLEILETDRDEEVRSYNKRFGCNHYRCPTDKMCRENHWGDAYCVDPDTPGVTRDETVEELANLEEKNYYKRFGCNHYQCPNQRMCLENRWGDAYCVDPDTPGVQKDEIAKELEFDEERSYNKRFGCNHYECATDKMCLENRWGDAYCVDADTPGVGKDEIAVAADEEETVNAEVDKKKKNFLELLHRLQQ